MSQINNPADRLLAIVKIGKSQTQTDHVIKVWSNVLSVPFEESSKLLRRISIVYSLPEQIFTKVKTIDDINSDLYLKWFSKVNHAFNSLQFNNFQWGQLMSTFDPSVEYGLEICADVLSRKIPDKTVDDGDLDNATTKIDELLQFIENDNDIDSITKNFIINALHGIYNAIEEISISGLSTLEKEFNSIVGSVVTNRDKYNVDSKKSESANKFWQIITVLSVILSIPASLIAIDDKINNELPENANSIQIEQSISTIDV